MWRKKKGATISLFLFTKFALKVKNPQLLTLLTQKYSTKMCKKTSTYQQDNEIKENKLSRKHSKLNLEAGN